MKKHTGIETATDRKKELVIKVLSCIFFIFTGSCAVISFQTNKSKVSKHICKKPNVILITISSLRSDHVGSLGYERQTTPNFDEFAQNNILFANFFATSSWQMPATGSIFTSLYPTEHGATHINKKLNQEIITLAEVLKENGFYSAGFCCNPRLSADYGFDQGFDCYDDYSVSMILSSMLFGQEKSFDINKTRTNNLINDAAIRWLQNNTHRPFFLFVHYYDNHWDYLPPPPYNMLFDADYQGNIDGTEITKEPLYSNKPSDEDLAHIIALYDGQVRQTDQDLGELLKFLKSEGRFEDSTIIVMGDHGEQFYEHGHTSHHGIFDELIHIPLAISIPELNESKVINSFVSGVDIMPTILHYLSIPIPNQCRGQSLNLLMEDAPASKRGYVYVEYTGGAIPDCSAVRFDRFKFVNEKCHIFAYDLLTDPGEHKKIYKDNFSGQMNEMLENIEYLLSRDKIQPENRCE